MKSTKWSFYKLRLVKGMLSGSMSLSSVCPQLLPPLLREVHAPAASCLDDLAFSFPGWKCPAHPAPPTHLTSEILLSSKSCLKCHLFGSYSMPSTTPMLPLHTPWSCEPDSEPGHQLLVWDFAHHLAYRDSRGLDWPPDRHGLQ